MTSGKYEISLSHLPIIYANGLFTNFPIFISRYLSRIADNITFAVNRREAFPPLPPKLLEFSARGLVEIQDSNTLRLDEHYSSRVTRRITSRDTCNHNDSRARLLGVKVDLAYYDVMLRHGRRHTVRRTTSA